MRKALFVLGITALVNIACGGTVNVEQEKTALLQRDAEWAASIKNQDTFLSFFAPNATVYHPGMPAVTGAGPIRDTFAKMTSMPGFAMTWKASKADLAPSGDLGYTAGTGEISMGGAPPEKLKYITIWKKIDGQWKVVEDIGNADTGPTASQHVIADPASLKWGEAPPSLPSGGKVAVVSGDPSKPGPFVVRVQVPAGYRIAPHWHPGDENLTILFGTVAVGMGEAWDDAKLQNVPAGGYAAMPAEMRHFFVARSASMFQINGVGPLVVNYVNPADDPSRKK